METIFLAVTGIVILFAIIINIKSSSKINKMDETLSILESKVESASENPSGLHRATHSSGFVSPISSSTFNPADTSVLNKTSTQSKTGSGAYKPPTGVFDPTASGSYRPPGSSGNHPPPPETSSGTYAPASTSKSGTYSPPDALNLEDKIDEFQKQKESGLGIEPVDSGEDDGIMIFSGTKLNMDTADHLNSEAPEKQETAEIEISNSEEEQEYSETQETEKKEDKLEEHPTITEHEKELAEKYLGKHIEDDEVNLVAEENKNSELINSKKTEEIIDKDVESENIEEEDDDIMDVVHDTTEMILEDIMNASDEDLDIKKNES